MFSTRGFGTHGPDRSGCGPRGASCASRQRDGLSGAPSQLCKYRHLRPLLHPVSLFPKNMLGGFSVGSRPCACRLVALGLGVRPVPSDGELATTLLRTGDSEASCSISPRRWLWKCITVSMVGLEPSWSSERTKDTRKAISLFCPLSNTLAVIPATAFTKMVGFGVRSPKV